MKTKTTFHGNSETGIPLEILGIRDLLSNYSLRNWLLILAATPFAYLWGKLKFDYDLLIAEMGIDSSQSPKNMKYLLEIIKPDIGIFLSVSAVHSEQFAEELNLDENDTETIIRAIAQEKGEIVTSLDDSSHAIINIDNPFIMELAPEIKAQVSTFGTSELANYRLLSHKVEDNSTTFDLLINNKFYKLIIPDFLLSKEFGSSLD